MTATTVPTKPRDPKAGAPIDRILQRVIGTAIVALVAAVIGMMITITDIKAGAETFMTRENGLSLEARMMLGNPPEEWRDRVRSIESNQHEILQELSAIRAVVERLARE